MGTEQFDKKKTFTNVVRSRGTFSKQMRSADKVELLHPACGDLLAIQHEPSLLEPFTVEAKEQVHVSQLSPQKKQQSLETEASSGKTKANTSDKADTEKSPKEQLQSKLLESEERKTREDKEDYDMDVEECPSFVNSEDEES